MQTFAMDKTRCKIQHFGAVCSSQSSYLTFKFVSHENAFKTMSQPKEQRKMGLQSALGKLTFLSQLFPSQNSGFQTSAGEPRKQQAIQNK